MSEASRLLAQWWRVGGVAGIIFLALFIVGIALQGDMPSHEEPTSQIREWFADNGKQYLVGDYLIGLGVVLFFLPFLSALRSLLGVAEGGPAVWSRVALIAGTIFAALGAAQGFFFGALAYGFGVVGQGDDATVRTLMYLQFYAFSSFTLIVAPLALASSLIIWRTGVLWRWLALLGLVVGILAIIAPLAVLDADPEGALAGIGFIGMLVAGLWVLLVSAAMVMKRSLPAPSA